MISSEQFDMMKPTARIVNCARGGIINEDDLYAALKEGKIAGAALDVFSKEPPENLGFQDIDNILVTPHLGASTEEAQVEVAVEAAQILVDALKGGPVKNALNAPSVGASVPAMVTHYAQLAERIGSMMATMSNGPVKKVEVQYRGSIAEREVSLLTTSFTIGLLQPHFDSPVNMVNVSLLAKERDISIDETKNSDIKDLVSSFSAKVVTDKGERSITGTVFGEALLRIVDIDGFKIEMTPAGTVLIIFNDDKPGVIGSVGSVCGKHGINISTMGVGQKHDEGKAVLAVSLDAKPDEKAIDELGKLDFVNELYVCQLDR
jgi:D-3-phosphoglycerate dehydrogenase